MGSSVLATAISTSGTLKGFPVVTFTSDVLMSWLHTGMTMIQDPKELWSTKFIPLN